MSMLPGIARPPFPKIIDNTIRCAFISCPQSWYKEHLLGYVPKATNIHLNFGGALAAGFDGFRKSYWTEDQPNFHNFDAAYFAGWYELTQAFGLDDTELTDEQMVRNKKSYMDLILAYDYYWKAYPPQTDHCQPHMMYGKPCSEFNFLLPLGVDHPETGEPLLYSGRFDLIANYNGMLFAQDEKTTSQLGPTWAKQWALRSQFTGYCWAARQFGHPVTGVVTRGIAILKNEMKSGESITYRSEHDIARWHEQVKRDVRRMIAAWQEGYFDYNLSDACNEFGGCTFREVCDKKNEIPWLKQGFKRTEWRPELGKRILLSEE